MSRLWRRAGGAALGLLLDRALGEPAAHMHPVALFGNTMSALEYKIWADDRIRGLGYTAAGVAIGAAAGSLLRSTSAAVAVAAASRELRKVASAINDANSAGDLHRARELLPSLVGRDPSALDASGVAAAVIESLAENSVDAVVAPAMWAMVAGAPGALAYRAINTMDAMVGHKSERFRNFGWSAARLDDAANYVPARVFHGLVQLSAWDQRSHIRAAVTNTAHAHPSPNAGVAEAAVAGALGIELGGPLQYGDLYENRPTLGSGPRPRPSTTRAAIELVDRAEKLLAAGLAAVAILSFFANRRR